jgi:hypothetical protein
MSGGREVVSWSAETWNESGQVDPDLRTRAGLTRGRSAIPLVKTEGLVVRYGSAAVGVRFGARC